MNGDSGSLRFVSHYGCPPPITLITLPTINLYLAPTSSSSSCLFSRSFQGSVNIVPLSPHPHHGAAVLFCASMFLLKHNLLRAWERRRSVVHPRWLCTPVIQHWQLVVPGSQKSTVFNQCVWGLRMCVGCSRALCLRVDHQCVWGLMVCVGGWWCVLGVLEPCVWE